MWPDRVSNPVPLTNESGALPTTLRCPAYDLTRHMCMRVLAFAVHTDVRYPSGIDFRTCVIKQFIYFFV